MKKQGKWVVNINDDGIWNNTERFEAKEEAIMFVKQDFEGFFEDETGVDFNPEIDDKVFYVGEIDRHTPSVNVDSVIVNLVDEAYSEVGEAAEGFLSYISKEDYGLLEDRLNKALNEWLDETKNQPTFWKVVNVEKVNA